MRLGTTWKVAGHVRDGHRLMRDGTGHDQSHGGKGEPYLGTGHGH